MIYVERYPNLDTLTHGWRWYRLENGVLRSPLQGYPTQLPLDGKLDGCYFVPRLSEIWSMAAMMTDTQCYPFALTFGTVSGPFARDIEMPRIGSMQCGSYQAQVIITDSTRALAEYRMPIVRGLDLPTMQRIEKAVSAL
ncbi:hypothetical protein [Mycobacterium marinum]|uniref:hypothetical protein n=1 Tax=Mycobacterium marinum TaxID=1781 RepID=UPI0023580C38|nr:hypothetical protein [Mycobacterium marinum]MDC9004089.1 hypothetical protein [Mycobacterium marinum]